MEGNLVSYNNGILTIGYADGFGIHKQAISKKEHKEFVEEAVSSYFNKEIRIEFIMLDDKKDNSKEDEKEEMIKEAVDFFGEDLVNIKR